ncbi:MAG: exonuclease SbcCD subunit D C-terminal domain-containing protein [Parabacteroides sp.]|nr:exonuclease SbcCD subunit D C-terminal domain-containing protein [Parabacteroides sp.]
MGLKIIHTADWHLGQTFFGYDRQTEHTAFLHWLTNTITLTKADVLFIAGDVFDVANPSAAAQRQFFRFLKEINQSNPGLQVVVIAGNHDSAARLEAPNPLLEELNTSVTGVVKRTDQGEIDFDSLLLPMRNREGSVQAWCMAVPFLRQGDYPPTDDKENNTYVAGVDRMYQQLFNHARDKKEPGQPVVAMGHLHVMGAELSDDDRSERVIMGGLEAVTSNTFHPALAYTALGHIHKAQRVGGRENIRYSGSPLPMSFSETNYRHQVVMVELDGDNPARIEPILIPQTIELIRVPKVPAIPEEVIAALSELPDKPLLEDEAHLAPFLEVRVLLTEPAPGFRNQVEEAIAGKFVRLTSIIPSYPKREHGGDEVALSFHDLQKIDPLDMVKRTYENKYANELPESIEKLFREVVQELNVKQEAQ